MSEPTEREWLEGLNERYEREHAEETLTALLESGIRMNRDSEFPFEVGWCSKHDDLARRYGDGSWSCWWECNVEARGEHQDSDFVPLLVAALRDSRDTGEKS